MTKKEVQQRVLQNGKPLPLDKFEWDEKTKTFSSNENDLVLDFAGIGNCTFNTGDGCTFKTGSICTFKTGSICTFKTGSICTFDTGWYCTFKTGGNCTFDTGDGCTFDTGWNCTFNTGWYCTFDTGGNCTLKTGSECVVVRRDVYEIIEIPEGKKIRLNEYGVKGYKVLVKKPKKVVLTMDEIAEKFGVPVDNLKIRK
jgi:hypothetical protein